MKAFFVKLPELGKNCPEKLKALGFHEEIITLTDKCTCRLIKMSQVFNFLHICLFTCTSMSHGFLSTNI